MPRAGPQPRPEGHQLSVLVLTWLLPTHLRAPLAAAPALHQLLLVAVGLAGDRLATASPVSAAATAPLTAPPLTRRSTAAEQAEQGAQPDQQLRGRLGHRSRPGGVVRNGAARGSGGHYGTVAGERRVWHLALLVVVEDPVVAGVVRQAIEQRFHCVRIAPRLADVPQGQSHALGAGVLAGM